MIKSKIKIFFKKNEINIFCSSKQDLQLTIKKKSKTKAFILFIADFFLKDI